MPIGLGIGLAITRGGTPGFSLTAPVLAFASATDPDSDNTQDFLLTVTAPEVDDVLTLQWDNNSDFSSVTGSATYTIVLADLTDFTGEITTGALADGAQYFRAKHSRGASDSAWSNTVTKTIDATAPTVSSFSPADNATDVAIDADLVVTFSEPVVLGASGTISLKLTSDDSTIDSWDVSADEGSGAGQLEVLNDDELHLHLTTDLDNDEEFYIVWGAGVVEDAVGNAVAALSTTTTWSFTTVAAAPSAATLTALTAANSATDGATGNGSYTFSAVTLSAGNKIVIGAALSFDNTAGVTLTCTVDGQATTLKKSQVSAGAFTAIFETDSTVAAASGDVVISYTSASRTAVRCIMLPFYLEGAGAASDSESGTATTSGVSTSSTLIVPSDGVGLAIAHAHSNAGDFTFTWTGHAESITSTVGGENGRADTAINTNAGTETVSADNGSATQKNIVAVAWPPA